MHILITGAAGMIGRKLTKRLLDDPSAPGGEISQLTLADIVETGAPSAAGPGIKSVVGDLSAPGTAERLIAGRPDLIFHLAAAVSGDAEANFEKGYASNLDGCRSLFEAIRREAAKSPYRPRLVFSSSIGVFGGPFPSAIGDDFLSAPLSSYGTQKAICELLLSDYSRRGIFEGVGIRLPTICIRPGKPNLAVSGFFSSIVREPLIGREAILPVGDEARNWFASPRAAIGFLIHAATLDLRLVGPRRNLNMPGLSGSVGEEIEALRTVAGAAAVRLIRREPDPAAIRMVDGWAKHFDPRRATALGFRAESSFAEIIRAHIDDELGGKIGG